MKSGPVIPGVVRSIPAVRALWVLALCVLCGGCASAKPIAITVRDAETDQPLPATKITLDYGGRGDGDNSNPINKKNVTVWTDGFGRAQIPANKLAAAKSPQPIWEIDTQHYINVTLFGVPGERIPPEIRPRFPRSGLTTASSADIRLYKLPVPTITIVVGDKFRGRIVLHATRSDEWVQDGEVGKRQFTFSPDADGLIEMQATPLLARELCRPFGYSALRFVTRSGMDLEQDWASVAKALSHSRAAPNTVCARLISDKPRWEKGLWQETTSIYVIGTAEDARAAATQP